MAPDLSLHQDLHLSLGGFQEKLCRNLCSLWKNSQLCDLIIKASGGIVLAHSCILAAFSSTVADMLSPFDRKFQEKDERCQKYVTIVVDHLSAEVLQSIISFIYTGHLVTSSKHTQELLEASKWLRMQDLIVLIEQTISEQKRQESQKTAHHTNQDQEVPPSGLSSHVASSSTRYVTVMDSGRNMQGSFDEMDMLKDLNHQLVPSTSKEKESTIDHHTNRNQQIKISGQSNNTPANASNEYRVAITGQNTEEINEEGEMLTGLSHISPHDSSSQQKLLPPREDSCIVTPAHSSANTHTRSVQSGSALSPPSHSNTKVTKSSQGENRSSIEVQSSKNNLSDNFTQPLLPVSKTSSILNCAKPSALPDQSDVTCRRGKRQRKRTKKWEESYLFSSSNSKSDEVENLIDCSVSLIKVEVDDLPSFISSPDQLNFLHCHNGFLSVSEHDDMIVNNECENNIIPCHSVDPNVLDEIIEIKKEVTEEDEIKTILDASAECDLTVHFETVRDIDNEVSSINVIEKCSAEQSTPKTTYTRKDTDQQDGKIKTLNASQDSFTVPFCSQTNTSINNKISLLNHNAKDICSRQLSSISKTASTEVARTVSWASGSGSSLNEVSQKNLTSDGTNTNQGCINNCMKELTSNISQRAASERHRLLYPYKCPKCFYRFDNIDKYNAHVNDHPIYNCQECPLFFYGKDKLTRHRMSVHMDNSHLICKECSFVASTGMDLCRHSTQEHNQPRPFTCVHQGCSFRSTKYYCLAKHSERVHTTEKNRVCDHCGKTVKNLSSHLQRCLRTEEHLCDLCGASFNLKQYLIYHKNVVHHNIRKYKCKHCFKNFGHHGNLRRHLRIHNNAYPYSCPACSKKFRHSNSLKDHLKIHQREGVTVEVPYDFSLRNYKKKVRNPTCSSR